MSTEGPIEITVSLEDAGHLQPRLESSIDEAIRRTKERLENEATEFVPYRTGELLESMRIWESAPGEVSIAFDASYARIVEMGAVPHTITGKGKPLSFWWPKGPKGTGQYAYWEVEHPGYSGRGFLNDVKQLAISILKEELAKAVAREFTLKAGGYWH